MGLWLPRTLHLRLPDSTLLLHCGIGISWIALRQWNLSQGQWEHSVLVFVLGLERVFDPLQPGFNRKFMNYLLFVKIITSLFFNQI